MSEQTHPLWNHFIRVVQEEVKPALGCTEPVSLALACAIAAEQLPGDVTKIEAWVSPNLMKNGLGVTVPGTGIVSPSRKYHPVRWQYHPAMLISYFLPKW